MSHTIDQTQAGIRPSIKAQRLYSLDVLRGFDMFWIIGGAVLVRSIDKYVNSPLTNTLKLHCHHVRWEGFVFHDLIFALFLFIAGVTLPISIRSKKLKGFSTLKIHRQLLLRCLLLVFLGVIYNMNTRFPGYDKIRYASVLGLIGISSYVAAILTLHTKVKAQLFCFIGVILTYYLLLKYYPVPNYGSGNFKGKTSFAGYIDQLFLPGKILGKYFDPEGIACVFSAIATALSGVMTGQFLLKSSIPKWKKMILLFGAGGVLLGAGYLWSYDYPIVKKMWTGTFVLVAAGYSLLLLSLFYGLFDVLKPKIKNKFLAFPLTSFGYFFSVIGLNSITIYLVYHTLKSNIYAITQLFTHPILQMASEESPHLAKIYFNISVLLLEWFFLLYLARKKIFLRI